jgi:hypothetical protein
VFDDVKDRIARLSVARLQKRIDELKAHQEMLDKFTQQRIGELEHYRLQLSIGVASIVSFTALILIALGLGVFAKIAGYYDLVAGLLALMVFVVLAGIWRGHCFQTIKYWQTASPINRAALQQRITDLEKLLTQRMAKRFGWSTKT